MDLSAGKFAYFYCLRDAAQPERAEPKEALRSLLRQLCFVGGSPKQLKPAAAEFYNIRLKEAADHGEEAIRQLDDEGCLELLVRTLSTNIQTVIVIDAVDELNPQTRWQLFEAFEEILSRVHGGSIVKIFVSSRNDWNIALSLEKYTNIYIEATDNQGDVEQFVEIEVAKAIHFRRILHGQVPEALKSDIIRALKMGAQGMFRWVSLQIQALCSPYLRSPEQLRNVLKTLPKTLQESYEVVYCQIQQMGDISGAVAMRAFQWVIFSQRQLKSDELLEALRIGEDTTTMPKDDHWITKGTLLDICCNLIYLDETLDAFRMVHLSVNEYFQQRKEYGALDSHSMSLTSCVDTLILHWSSEPMTHSSFVDYAVAYWAQHCSMLQPQGPIGKTRLDIEAILLKKPCPGRIFRKWQTAVHQSLRIGQTAVNGLQEAAQEPLNPFFVACSFNLTWLVDQILCDKDFDTGIKTESGNTGIHLSCILGHTDAVSALLSHNIDINAIGAMRRTPLLITAQLNYSALLAFLISKGANVNAVNAHDWTPLHEAAYYGYLDAAQVLLENGATIDARDKQNHTPLVIAGMQNMHESVAFLLRQGASPYTTGFSGNSTMESSSMAVLRTLQKHGVDFKHPSYLTAARAAVREKKVDVLTELIDAGVDINHVDIHHRAPLDYALEIGYEDAISLLINHKASIALRWLAQSQAIHQWKGESWYPALLEIITSTNETSVAPFAPISNRLDVMERNVELIVTPHSPDTPYVYLRVPATMIAVTRIVFITISHDQGWSDTQDRNRGTYNESYSWFEVDTICKRLPSKRLPLQANLNAVKSYTTHEIIWDVHTSEETHKEVLRALRPGDVVQVYAKAQHIGWANFVKSVKIELQGTEASSLRRSV